MKKKLSFRGNIAVFTLCIALVIAASFYALSVRQLNVVYTPADSKESTADITNPFCGFYKINGYVLAEDKTAKDADIWCQRSCKDTPYPLMLLEINLRNYADQDLSANALSQLNRIFKICEKKKKQIGRAPWRARGWISVGAGTVKKAHNMHWTPRRFRPPPYAAASMAANK